MSGQSGTQDASRVTICIMRHGMAEQLAPRDAQRELVEFGERQAHHTARWFKAANPSVSFDLAVVSPYIRAKQTFDIVHQYLQVERIEESADITPDADASRFHDYLCAIVDSKDYSHALQNILIVSHMPFVSLLVAQLTEDPNAELFNTGAMAIISCDRKTLRGNLLQHHQGLF